MYLTVIIVLLLNITFSGVQCKLNRERDICYSPQCIQMDTVISNHVDFSADPCEDFHKFSCGNFISQAYIPDDKSSISLYSDIVDSLNEQLRIAMEEPIQTNEPKAFALAKKLYQACMNTELIEEIGLNDIKDMLKKLGGWPVVEGHSWKGAKFDWMQTISMLKKEGFSRNFLISLGIEPDCKNTSKRILYLEQASLGMNREFLMESREVEIYYDYMVDIATSLGADKQIAKQELLESLHFEIKLAEMSLPQEERQDPLKLYHPMTVDELQHQYPSIRWLEYINGILKPDATITKEEDILIYVPKYISVFEKLINHTPKRVQANYLLWRAVKSSVYYLNKELRERQFEFVANKTGRTKQNPRWKQCISTTKYGLPVAVGALYVRRYFEETSRNGVKQIVSNIQSEFKEILQNVEWMDNETRHSALKKLNAMSAHVAYPDELMDDVKLDQHYLGLEVNSTNFWKSMLNIYKFDDKYAFSRFRLPVNKTDWITYSSTFIVDAFYSSLRNAIKLPAGHLQGFFFHKDNPNYINYGGVGYIIGHEVTHGFDNKGKHYDEDGNMINWWANHTRNSYNEKTKCIIDQYNNFTIPEIGIHVNGINTLDENIADIGGIKQAYLAYVKWIRKYGEDQRLPSFRQFNGRQMYWIAAGLSWCIKERPTALRQQVMTDVHAPAKYRLWGPVMNSYEFAKDFKCEPNTKMNPEKKCQIW